MPAANSEAVVKALVDRGLDRVEQLRTLLLVCSAPSRSMSVAEVLAGAEPSESDARLLLLQLEELGLLTISQARVNLDAEILDQLIAIERVYRRDRQRVVNAFFARRLEIMRHPPTDQQPAARGDQ